MREPKINSQETLSKNGIKALARPEARAAFMEIAGFLLKTSATASLLMGGLGLFLYIIELKITLGGSLLSAFQYILSIGVLNLILSLTVSLVFLSPALYSRLNILKFFRSQKIENKYISISKKCFIFIVCTVFSLFFIIEAARIIQIASPLSPYAALMLALIAHLIIFLAFFLPNSPSMETALLVSSIGLILFASLPLTEKTLYFFGIGGMREAILYIHTDKLPTGHLEKGSIKSKEICIVLLLDDIIYFNKEKEASCQKMAENHNFQYFSLKKEYAEVSYSTVKKSSAIQTPAKATN